MAPLTISYMGRVPAKTRARNLARALTARGRQLASEGRYRDAAPVLRRALTASERAFGRSSLAVAWALNDLGMCYKFLARFSEAGPLYQRALAIVEARLGPDHADVASLYHNLGGLEHAAGNWLRGEPFARHAVRIRKRALGPRHPVVAHDMTALAALLDRQKKYDEAERLYTASIGIFEREHGPDHPDLAVPLNNLAAVYQARGRPKQAELLYRRALAIHTEHAGGRHLRVGFCANNLAVLLKSRGRHAEAADLFRQALAIFADTVGRDHPNIAVCLENYAEVLRKLGRRAEAARSLRRATRLTRRVETVNDEGVAATGTINPMFARFRLAAGPSRINRLGVFAQEPIPAGRLVIEYTGERVARVEARRRWDPARSYLFYIDNYWQIDGAIGGSGAEIINHSCDPNLKAREVRKRILYFSCRAIKRGEELTVDYRYDAELKPMTCHCGAPTCRGTMNLRRKS